MSKDFTMLRVEHTTEYLRYVAKQELARRIEQSTHTLIQLMHIDPYGSGLILLCGKSGDKTNTDAVRTWVTKYLCCPSCMRKQHIGKLASRFERELNDKIESYSR